MINERKFASQFSNFWRSTLPNLEATTRSINLGYQRFGAGVTPGSRPDRRDLVSETGYRLFRICNERSEIKEIEALDFAVSEAFSFFRRELPDVHSGSLVLDADERLECISIRNWIAAFVRGTFPGKDVTYPSFRGHGLLSGCEGDMVVDDCIVEIKYVDRPFRSADLRQVLAYCFLKYQETKLDFKRLCLVNPFSGCYFISPPSDVIYSASGITTVEFYEQMSYALSSGEISR